MNKRREARQLCAGDQFQVSLTVHVELAETVIRDDGRITLVGKVVPCGPNCGESCECESAVFKEAAGPFAFELKGSQRIPYFGNLKQLLEDSERIRKQIARFTGTESETISPETQPNLHPDLSKGE